jgi:hypothetical protein
MFLVLLRKFCLRSGDTEAITLGLDTQTTKKARTNRKHKMRWCYTWCEVQLFIIVQLSSNGQKEILKRVQAVLDLHLVSSLILYNVDLFQSSEGQVWAVYFVIQFEIIFLRHIMENCGPTKTPCISGFSKLKH